VPRRNCLGHSRPVHLIGAFYADQFAMHVPRARNSRSCWLRNRLNCRRRLSVFWLIEVRREAASRRGASDCNADVSRCHDLRCRCSLLFDSGNIELAGGWMTTADADDLICAKLAPPRMKGPPRRTL
jgi:hypothetical protein